MKKITFIASFLLVASVSFAQTAEEIIGKYITAIGGKDAISKIQDYSMTMSGEVQGTALEIVVQKKAPNKSLTVVTVSGMGEVQRAVCDGTKGRTSGMQGTVDITSGKDLAALLEQSKLFPEATAIAAGVKLTLGGTEKIGGKDAYRIEASLGETKWTEYYEVASGLKVRQVTTTEQGSITSDFDDYREVSGVKFPYKMNQDAGMFQIAMTASKIEVNKAPADAIFEIK